MRKFLLALVFASGLLSTNSNAGVINLADYRFNVNGVVSVQTAPAGVSLAGFNTGTGLGTITATFNSPGAYYFGAFLDHEIDEAINTYFNEFGASSGAPASGLTWEIDEPGFVFGDIVTNFGNSALDGMNGVPSGAPDDVSMALAWSFTLAADEQATITMLVSTIAPLSGFYLQQTDPDSIESIYFSTGLSIVPTVGGVVPEPSSIFIFLGIIGVSIRRQRKP
jgi:hypothetical protein